MPPQVGLGKLPGADPRTSACSHHCSRAGGSRPQLSAFSAPPLLAELINRWNHTPACKIPPASIETNPSDAEHHLGGLSPSGLSTRPAGRSAPQEAGAPAGHAGESSSDAPTPLWTPPRSPNSGCSPPGLSSFQAQRHVDYFVKGQFRRRGEEATTCARPGKPRSFPAPYSGRRPQQFLL